jgi:hypothetical protein
MKTASIHQLIKEIVLLETSIKLNRSCYTTCNERGDQNKAKLYFKIILRSFNEIAELSTRIATLKMSGDTDVITTAHALSILGIDYSVRNTIVYINS